MYRGVEKRKYQRINKPFIIRFRIRPDESNGMVTTAWDMVVVGDLSAGGVCFQYNKYLGVDSLLDIKINCSKSTPLINCIGKINRIKEQPNTSVFGIATTFTEIDKHNRYEISKVVENSLRKEINPEE